MRESLRSRRMDHQFHYVSNRQAQRWLALHQRHSPSRSDEDCSRIYEEAFARCVQVFSGPVQLVGLGCGGGRKDARLLRALQGNRKPMRYVAADVSPALVNEAREYVQECLGMPLSNTRGLVADFMSAENLDTYWRKNSGPDERQLFSFLGMMPNFDPDRALGLLSQWLRPGDLLLLSANLAPGENYDQGCRAVLPQYDNIETRHWLITVMEDLGFNAGVEDIHFEVKEGDGVKRVESTLIIPEDCRIAYEGSGFSYKKGEVFRLFYSNRFQVAQLDQKLTGRGFRILDRYVAGSGEEGVWVLEKA